jgi:hypothetical protein
MLLVEVVEDQGHVLRLASLRWLKGVSSWLKAVRGLFLLMWRLRHLRAFTGAH